MSLDSLRQFLHRRKYLRQLCFASKTRGRPNFGFGFGFGVLQLVNSVVAESRVQTAELELRRQRMRQTHGAISLTFVFLLSAAVDSTGH